MTTAAVVGVAGKHLVHTLLHPPIDVADRSKLFPEQAISQLNTVGRHRVVCAKSTSHSSKTSCTGRQRQTLKALKDANASSASPIATSAVLEEDEHAQLQQTMEALLLLQKSLLEKQWTLPFDMDDDSRETKSTDSPETAEIVRSKRPSARSRRLASRKNSSICSLKSEIAERISKKNKGTLLSAAFPGQVSKSSRSRLSLLTPEEVIWLSKKIQAGIQLKNIRSRLKAKLGFEPTKAQWAASVNMSLVELNATLMEYSTAKEKLKMSNIRLVLSIARKYENLGLEMGDLIREGLSGLARGIEKFDASKGYKLSTYVYWWIRQSITKALTEHSKVTPVPRHLQKRLKLILSAKEELKSKGIVPSTQSIAKFLNMSTSMVKNAKKVLEHHLFINLLSLKPFSRLSDIVILKNAGK
eukprot:TRINITY_DN667_c0_g1_i3.p1 TRINITY_DN667_c0_g1~~TRINITY_DN667_c0_g1_i3.p1  ORF type:complete len:414 (+),score=67.70 TRINITY_DN667_c0_g1_i3:376-1617(+)